MIRTVEPKFLIAQHKLDERPPQLFWFDLPTLLALAGITDAATSGDENDTAVVNDDNKNPRLLLATQVQDSHNDDDDPSRHANHWPARPTAEAASEFRISPAVHAGYAFTWYSLSAAGLYMTRKLLTRGRG